MNRREILKTLASMAVAPAAAGALETTLLRPAFTTTGQKLDDILSVRSDGWITDVPGIKVGHFTETRRPTGCTVILCDEESICGVAVPGGNPGTRLTDMLAPIRNADNSVRVGAVVLTGGSDFGLASASGVERFLRERYFENHKSNPMPEPHVPIVPAAVIFDLFTGQDWRIVPTEESGYTACQSASTGKVAEGCAGAGTGAQIGYWGGHTTKSGLGTSSLKAGDSGVVVGAICAVNAVGDVYNPKTGKLVAGSRTPDGKSFRPISDRLRNGEEVLLPPAGTHTTISCVATNAKLETAAITKVAQMASAAHARVVKPSWTPGDGDTVFAISTGMLDKPVDHGAIGALCADALEEAILRAVVNATSVAGLPCYRDVMQGRV
jgi:L-aminopeptidase/D-esterase-like protein